MEYLEGESLTERRLQYISAAGRIQFGGQYYHNRDLWLNDDGKQAEYTELDSANPSAGVTGISGS